MSTDTLAPGSLILYRGHDSGKTGILGLVTAVNDRNVTVAWVDRRLTCTYSHEICVGMLWPDRHLSASRVNSISWELVNGSTERTTLS